MVNIDSLPKSIKYNGNVYMLDLHVTAWNKLCVSYKYIFGSKDALEKKIETFILSEVVEPDNITPNYSNKVDGIVDVNSWEMAFMVLASRLNTALSEGIIEMYK